MTITESGMLTLINPVPRAEPFDHPDWVFEAAAENVRGRLISCNGNQTQRFEGVLDLVFDGEVVVLDYAERPPFNELLFGRRRPIYVAFDLLIADGVDRRPLPRKPSRKSGWQSHQENRRRAASSIARRFRKATINSEGMP
jgi:hypothetical protein